MNLRLHFGTTEVCVNATSALVRLLEVTHRRHAAPPETRLKGHRPQRELFVELAPPACSPEFALRDAQREIAGEVASSQGWVAIGAAVVEHNGRALALVGPACSGKSTLAAHFLARGWRLLSDDVAFLDAESAMVVGHHGLMAFRSGSIPHLPAAFKPTLERSRWLVNEEGELLFYEVDPANTFGPLAWSGEAVLDAVLLLNDAASIEAVETIELAILQDVLPELAEVASTTFAAVRVGTIGKERASRTVDRIEDWYGTLDDL